MNNNTQKTRAEIPNEYKWNIEAMYPDEKKVLEDIETSKSLSNMISNMKGKIMESPQSLLKVLMLYSSCLRLIEKVFVYTHMRHDEDNSNTKYSELYGIAVASYSSINANLSFIVPELLESKEEKIKEYISKENGLEEYRFMLEEIMNQKEHTLSPGQEYVIASLGEIIGSPDEIFSTLNDVDLKFGNVVKDGIESPLTHSSFIKFMESERREDRKDAYYRLYDKYKELNNTISSIYNYNVKADTAISSIRKYNTTLERSLSNDKIPLSVYYNLINAVHKHLPKMHEYVQTKKKILGIENMYMYDVYKPITSPTNISFTFEQAVNLACEALAPLGDDYLKILKKGLLKQKWVDIYENVGKTSGAYSFGSYDSYPYILMNFSGELRDVFTLVHEAGHSMHSYYTRRNQPYIYGDHSIFTAEVASTVNETLLMKYLLEHCDNAEMQLYLINFYIDEFKSTLFRQTMFAEFELIAHEEIESGGSLTAEFLNTNYEKLNKFYYGPAIEHDDMIQYEWSRIPHFYRSYYVYQYATGYSAANAIANKILIEGESAAKDYIEFLKSGSSNYPIELLKIANVDMSTEEPVLSALYTFDELVDNFKSLVEEDKNV